MVCLYAQCHMSDLSLSHFASWQYSRIASAYPSPKKALFAINFLKCQGEWNSSSLNYLFWGGELA